jgi:hypothetical protein
MDFPPRQASVAAGPDASSSACRRQRSPWRSVATQSKNAGGEAVALTYQVTAWASSSGNIVPLAPPMVAMAAAVPPEVGAIDSTAPCDPLATER